MSRKDMSLRLKAVENFVELDNGKESRQSTDVPDSPPKEEPRGVVLQRRGLDLPKGAGPRAKRGIIERQDGRVRRRRTAYFDPEVDRRLRMWCEENGHEVSVVINEAVRSFLEESR